MERLAVVLIAALVLSSCGGGTSGNTPTSPTIGAPPATAAPPPAAPVAPAACFTFPVARVETSANSHFMDLTLNAPASCSWTATTATSWITIERSGSLYKTGTGQLRFDIEENKDARFGGCTTSARTGAITVMEQSTNVQRQLAVVQQGSSTPFQPPTSCTVSALPYGSTISANMTASDCTVAVSGARAKYYTFQGLADQSIELRLTAGRFTSGGLRVPVVRLFGPGGGFVVGAGNNVVVDNPGFTRNLACGGGYVVQVTSGLDQLFNPTGLGAYTLRLTSQN